MSLAGGLLFLFLVFFSSREALADHYVYHTLEEVHYQHRYPYSPVQTVIFDGRTVILPCSLPTCSRHCLSEKGRGGALLRSRARRSFTIIIPEAVESALTP